jgi:hypothetical protein
MLDRCPPCRGYTPQLSDAYKASSKQGETAIIFVSSDQDEAAFDEYQASMSFDALPYAVSRVDRSAPTAQILHQHACRGAQLSLANTRFAAISRDMLCVVRGITGSLLRNDLALTCGKV